jgi:hypothetical protein
MSDPTGAEVDRAYAEGYKDGQRDAGERIATAIEAKVDDHPDWSRDWLAGLLDASAMARTSHQDQP